ncbi:MAG: hypothetical protein IPP19_06655 [Verrucomicrobia bacterium]|nr:hypothetical protein [Verrucomicrobiota bacterium]
MQETLRTLLFTVSLLIFFGSYLSLLGRAFKRDPLWGVFAVFGAPFGGWLHGVTTWYENSRLMLVHLVAGVAAFGAFFFFPRIPATGFWTDDSGQTILNLQADGSVRNYGLASDCTYGFRPARVITKDMPFTSPLRLKFQGTNDFGVGYYNPKAATLDLYESSKDPVYINNTIRPSLALKRVPAPTDAAFQTKLAHMISREVVADRARLLATTSTQQPVANLLTDESKARFHRYVTLARSGNQPGDTIIDQIYAKHLRAFFREELKSNTSVETLLAAELKQTNFLLLATLQNLKLEAVNVNTDGNKATVVFIQKYPPHSLRSDLVMNLAGIKDKDGLWRFDLFQLRDRDIQSSMRGSRGIPIDTAEEYLQCVAVAPMWELSRR